MLYAVGHADFFNNDLKIEIIEATDIKDAIRKHSEMNKGSSKAGNQKWLEDLPDKLEGADGIKQFFFDSDSLIDVKEIKYATK